MRSVALAVILLASSTFAVAQEGEQPDCKNQITQLDMNICAHLDFETADKELNAVWKEARAAAKEMDEKYDTNMQGAEAALLAAQRGWIAYRDGHCELAGWEAHGGSMEPMLVSGCLERLTRERTKQLREFISGEEQ